MRVKPAALSLALAAALGFSAPASAEDVKAAIQEALEAYEAGDLAEAKFSLDSAAQLVSALRAKDLSAVLPEALDGWRAEESSADMGAAMAMFGGGGLAASRDYNKRGDDGFASVTINVVIDSPMIMQFAGILANPQLTASMGESVRFGRHRGVQSENGEIQIVVANRALVTVSADGRASPEDARAYAGKIDFDKIANF